MRATKGLFADLAGASQDAVKEKQSSIHEPMLSVRRHGPPKRRMQGVCGKVQVAMPMQWARNPHTYFVTNEYERGMEAMGWNKDARDKHCNECGLLPAWCECLGDDSVLGVASVDNFKNMRGPRYIKEPAKR
jgi:hypothetical protein